MYGLLFHRSYFTLLFSVFLLCSGILNAQADSEKGWILPTQGTLRVLMVFVEIDHDVDPSVDDFPQGHKNWKVNQLPEYKDDIFNAFEGEDT